MDILIKLLTIPAGSAVFYNDVLVLISFFGSMILFLGSFPNSAFKRWEGLAEWNSAPLVFGAFFQISLILTGFTADDGKIGFLIPMSLGLVNALFLISFLLMGARWWVRRKLTQQS